MYLDFRLMNTFGDLEDLEVVLGKKNLRKVTGSGSCSAMVKLFPGNKDLGISQVTWNDYNSMLRIFKLYNTSYHMHPGTQWWRRRTLYIDYQELWSVKFQTKNSIFRTQVLEELFQTFPFFFCCIW